MIDLTEKVNRERPILMNAEMVRAVLGGRKTQTRRPMKETYHHGSHADAVFKDGSGHGWVGWWGRGPHSAEKTARYYPGPEGFPCPFGQPGDRLWVRETWMENPQVDAGNGHGAPLYKASWGNTPDGAKWVPSIHMPRWASRITLEITDMRVERVQDISEADAVAEGIEQPEGGAWRDYGVETENNEGYHWCRTAVDSYRTLWDSIYADKGPAWAANPWVWVIGFKRIEV